MLFQAIVEDSADGADNHLTHLTQAVDCHQKSRKDQNVCGPNATKSRSVLYHSVKSTDAKEDDDGGDGHFDRYVDSHVNCCVGKEDGIDDSADVKKEQNACGPSATKSRSVLYCSVKSTDAKEDDDDVDDSADGCFNGCVDGHVEC
eukprot:12397984-Ditylum_brightwellii.AAC.1